MFLHRDRRTPWLVLVQMLQPIASVEFQGLEFHRQACRTTYFRDYRTYNVLQYAAIPQHRYKQFLHVDGIRTGT